MQGRCIFLTALIVVFVVPFGLRSVGSETGNTTPGTFVDITQRCGIHFQHRASPTSKKYLPETMGSGVALFDYDNDGLLDIYLVNGAPIDDPTPVGTIPKKNGPSSWNRLYHQKKDGSFEDVTERAGVAGTGYGMGVAVGDYDNDGYEDLYVTQYGHNILYHNNGDGTFTDVTTAAGVGGSGWSTSAAWVDYDNDGKLDLIVARYLNWDFSDLWCGERQPGQRAYCHPDLFQPITLLLYHNEDGKHFREVSQKAGLIMPGKGLGIAIADYDHDGYPDIFIANDSMREFLFHNKRNGTFDEVGLESEVAVDGDGRTYAGMGVDFADYNNDGWPDLIITDLGNQKYASYTNSHDGTFQYASYTNGLAGITLLHSGWGVRSIDYDNDGWKDLFVAQGHVLDTIDITTPTLHYREPPLLARNNGRGFVDVSKSSGPVFSEKWAARGLASGDIDNDGKQDVVVTTNNGPAYVLRNETKTNNHWLMLKLVGTRSNRDGIGASVKVTTSAGIQYATVTTAGSYCSSSDIRTHFGLDQETRVRDIEVHWPSGVVQHLSNVPADQIITVTEPRQ
ncbi:MAG TPA: CRTAC1 family protein [Bryobacteraceae bacterium]|nr:CRTAC1 family protein [Bryobacteraceae bacterium]